MSRSQGRHPPRLEIRRRAQSQRSGATHAPGLTKQDRRKVAAALERAAASVHPEAAEVLRDLALAYAGAFVHGATGQCT